MLSERANIISGLQTDILRLQGLTISRNKRLDMELGPIKHAFPDSSFPIGAVHEFLASFTEDATATSGFIVGLLSSLMGNLGTTIWISSSRTLFPPALKNFGIEPDRFIFIDIKKERDVLWAMNEALKCEALSAVVAEMSEISFKESRRLQLAVEKSKVTGFILRKKFKVVGTSACVSRWNITQLPAESIGNLPGIGYPKWRVELSRIRNGKAGVWDMAWINGKFVHVGLSQSEDLTYHKQIG